MNYTKHYRLLIARAKNRLLEGYCEKHHIIPTCLGGSNIKDNIAALTPEEHYVAHQLLVKMYPIGSKERRKLIHAVNMMSGQKNSNLKRNNKSYGWVRREHAKTMSERLTGIKRKSPTLKQRAKLSAALKGKTYEEIHGVEKAKDLKKLRAAARKGNTYNVGRSCRKETKDKISIALKGKPLTEERKQKIAAAHRKPVIVDDVHYDSHTHAAKAYNITSNTIASWIKTKNNGAYNEHR